MKAKNENVKNMREYLGANKYALANDGVTELYPIAKNKSQVYLEKNGLEVLAKKKNEAGKIVPYFAVDHQGFPIAPKKLSKKGLNILHLEYTKSANNKQLYPKFLNREYYICNDGSKKFSYALDETQKPYYASKPDKNYYYSYFIDENDDKIEYPIPDNYIMKDDNLVYPRNVTQKTPVILTDDNKNQLYLSKNNKEFYPLDKNTLPLYLKDSESNEMLAIDNGTPYYASFQNQFGQEHQYLPKLKSGEQFYLEINNQMIYPKSLNNSPYYAKAVDGSEILALDSDELLYYLKDVNGVERYPKTAANSEYYRTQNNVEMCAINSNTNTFYYAKNSDGTEIYPKSFAEEENDEEDMDLDLFEDDIFREPTEQEILEHLSFKMPS